MVEKGISYRNVRTSLMLASLLGLGSGLGMASASQVEPQPDSTEPPKPQLGFKSDHWLSHPRAKHCANPDCGSPTGHKLTKSQRREIRTFNARMAGCTFADGGLDNG